MEQLRSCSPKKLSVPGVLGLSSAAGKRRSGVTWSSAAQQGYQHCYSFFLLKKGNEKRFSPGQDHIRENGCAVGRAPPRPGDGYKRVARASRGPGSSSGH